LIAFHLDRSGAAVASYSALFSIRRLWLIFAASMLVMFGTLLYFGQQIYQTAPPIPSSVRSQTGETIFTQAQIEQGQNVWQSMGGMEQGSIWGHGSYVAPDWSADWLHREALALQNTIANVGA
jgi:nitric oxide reductase subunit B